MGFRLGKTGYVCPLGQASLPLSPSRWGAGMVVMKNWLELVLGPVLAIDRMPGESWIKSKFSSSNLFPYIE